MGRPQKKVTVEEVGFVCEWMVGRVNRADWRLGIWQKDKRKMDNGKSPKEEAYRLAAIAVMLQRPNDFKGDLHWLKTLERLLVRVNAWVDQLKPADRGRMWTAWRASKSTGLNPFDTLICEHFTYLNTLSE